MKKNFVILLTVLLLGCGSNPIAPSSKVKLTVSTNFTAIIMFSWNAQKVGSTNTISVSTSVPIHTDIKIYVKQYIDEIEHVCIVNLDKDMVMQIGSF